MFARQKIAEVKFAHYISKFERILELKIANEQIFIEIAKLKNAK